MKKYLNLAVIALISGVFVSCGGDRKDSGIDSASEKQLQDSIEAARLDSIRQDSIARRNFTTPDLALNELHGHVAKCQWGNEADLYYPTKFSYNKDGRLENSADQKYTRNKNGQIIKVSDSPYDVMGYKWSDNRVSCSQLLSCEGETAYGGGDVHYFYGADGLLAYTTTDGGTGENGEMRNMKTVYSDYKFDEMGNWISRKSTTTYQTKEYSNDSWENHTEHNNEVRVITYYDSEIGKDKQDYLNNLHHQRVNKTDSGAADAKQQSKSNIPDWMQGTWHLDINGPNGIAVANYTITIDGNYATMLNGRQMKYSGECHIEDGKLYLGNSSSYDINGQSLYYRQYRLTKDGSGASWSGSFRTDSDVMRYLTDHTFYSDSHRISFTYNSCKIDGYAVSGAPRISSVSSSSATIVVNPIGGGGAVYLYLNASNGTINYDGDIFRAR